jgi:ATP-dependent Zn protease
MAKSIVSWVALLLTIVLLYNVFTTKPSGKETILAFSKFLSEVNNKNIKRARIVDSDLTGELITGEHFKTVIPTDYPQLYDRLAAAGVDYKIEHPTPSPWMAALISWAPFLFIIGFWIFFMRKMQMTAKRKNVSMEQQTHETNLVELEPDVAKAFSNSQVVNEALRLVIQLTEIRGTT